MSEQIACDSGPVTGQGEPTCVRPIIVIFIDVAVNRTHVCAPIADNTCVQFSNVVSSITHKGGTEGKLCLCCSFREKAYDMDC